jgi:hypothetical protein
MLQFVVALWDLHARCCPAPSLDTGDIGQRYVTALAMQTQLVDMNSLGLPSDVSNSTSEDVMSASKPTPCQNIRSTGGNVGLLADILDGVLYVVQVHTTFRPNLPAMPYYTVDCIQFRWARWLHCHSAQGPRRRGYRRNSSHKRRRHARLATSMARTTKR